MNFVVGLGAGFLAALLPGAVTHAWRAQKARRRLRALRRRLAEPVTPLPELPMPEPTPGLTVSIVPEDEVKRRGLES